MRPLSRAAIIGSLLAICASAFNRLPSGDSGKPGSDSGPSQPPDGASAWARRAVPLEPPSDATPPPPATAPAAGSEWSRAASETMPTRSAPTLPPAAAGSPAPVETAPKTRTPLGRLRLDVLALLLAVGGGLFGILGAFVQEAQALAGALLLVFIGAPVIEEALKPSGIYLLLVRWPSALRSQLHVAALCAISGLTFGLVESLAYTEVYYPDGSDSFILYRFTVTPALHATASFIVGLGLSRATVDWAAGRVSLPKLTRNCFLAGAGLHAVYNTGSVVLGLLGFFDFLSE